MSSFRKLIGIMLLVYALICIPTYGFVLLQGFDLVTAVNLVLMLFLGGLVVYDLFQDHFPLEVIVEHIKESIEEGFILTGQNAEVCGDIHSQFDLVAQ